MDTTTKSRSSTLGRLGLWGAAASICIALAPIAISIMAGSFGSLLGCQVDESGMNPCPLGPVDIGGLLSTLGVMGWFSVITIPLGLLGLLASMTLLLIRFWLYALRRAKGEAGTSKGVWLALPVLATMAAVAILFGLLMLV